MKQPLEQHVAVFGESGSGKTVLLSSFFGAAQEQGFAKRNLFNVVADHHGQAIGLYQNYLGMRDSRTLPESNEFRSTSYGFKLKMAGAVADAQQASASNDEMRIVWHDYPGQWFEKEVVGEEAQRRVDGFKALLGSDVAILLVDAQRLIDNDGQEQAYLKSLFFNYREGFKALKGDILDDGKPLLRFPRIWILALSKADLLPDLDVRGLRDLVIGKAGADLSSLGDTIAEMIDTPTAMSFGEDFMLLSSARFTSDEILLDERIGLDLILPVASVLPLERHMHWVGRGQLPAKLGKQLLKQADVVAAAIGGVLGLLAKNAPKQLRPVVALLATLMSKEVIEEFTQAGRDKLNEVEQTAVNRRDYITAVLTRFRLALQDGEKADVLLRGVQ